MKLKSGVRILGASPELIIGLMVAQESYTAQGERMVITSISDGGHKTGSLHHAGRAADLRIPYGTGGGDLALEIAEALGSDWDVIRETDHIHIEYDPKK